MYYRLIIQVQRFTFDIYCMTITIMSIDIYKFWFVILTVNTYQGH